MSDGFEALPLALLGSVAREGRAAGVEAYLVGGALRDVLLGRDPVDLDVALEGPVRAAVTLVSALQGLGWACEARHDRFGTARLRAPSGERLDLAVTREETYAHPGALPVVKPGVPIVRDLARRDFTVHAMARRLGPGGFDDPILDPFGGETDLRLRSIRLLHEGSLVDDPTRAIRAARYAARLGFSLDPGFEDAVRRSVASGAFERISGDRLRRALHELLSEENRGVALEILARLSVPSAILGGWAVAASDARRVGEASGPDEAWRILLEPAPSELRLQVASRLNFSRAQRRGAGCPR